MDTNLIALLLQAGARTAVSPSPTTVVLILAAVAPTLAALAAWLQSRANAANHREAKLVAEETTSTVGKILVDVNSEKTRMINKLEEAETLIRTLTEEVAKLTEKASPKKP